MITNIDTKPTCKCDYGYQRVNGIYVIKSCMFDTPRTLDKAISEISVDEKLAKPFSYYRDFTQKTFDQIKKDLASNKKLKDIKVNGMIDYGQTALVFETDKGDILKITSRDHFLGRKPEIFDIPIKEHIANPPKSYCHYYLEEKVLKNFSYKELGDLYKNIRELGYKVVDDRIDQFGKTKDGKLVLIDHECVRKRGVLGLLKYKFAKLKAYAKIAMK